jgi:3-deoxy-D-manno-octulosonic-acid transferase
VIAIYNAILLALLALGSPLLLLWVLASPRRRSGFAQRLRPLARRAHDCVWVHAASVGEVEAAAPLIAALRGAGRDVITTTLTATGRERLRALDPAGAPRLAPLDLPGLVGASLARARVRALVLVETELWPNLLHAAQRRGVRTVLVSARISDRSLPRYRRLRWLFGPLLRRLDALGARSEADRARFVALGVRPEAASVCGDLKLARPAPAPAGEDLRAALGAGPFLLGGSTHPGEESALLEAWRALRAGGAEKLRLVLAPRHPERADEVLALARASGARVALRSRGASDADVVVIDGVGELGALYGLCALCFVGGSLVPVGGHNLLEPVQAGRVALHGPHVHNQRAQLELLEPLGVLVSVADAAELCGQLARLWSDPQRDAPARAAQAALAAHRGAAQRALALVQGVART